MPGGVAVYPGTFNPPTVAHLAIAEAAWSAGGLLRVDLVVSAVPLGKDVVSVPSLEDRLGVLRQVVAARPHLGLRLSSAQLVVDVAAGADAVIVGADKWAQLVDPHWYGGSTTARDEALSRLPLVLVAPRPPWTLPEAVPGRILILPALGRHLEVSSTAVRSGRREWMAPEAMAFDERSGAWSEPGRYRPGHHGGGDEG